MIDPINITNFNMTTSELEETIIWWVLAAGKNGIRAAKCTELIMKHIHQTEERNPFNVIAQLSYSELIELFVKYKTGAHTIKAKTVFSIAKSGVNLHDCTREDLLKFWGMGMKTASCFILHSRPNQEMAGIDTHYLKFLKDNNVYVPKTRPIKLKSCKMHPEYLRMELEGIKIAKKLGLSCAALDLTIWNTYRMGEKLII